MGHYLISILTAVVVGSVAELLPPDGDGGMSRSLKLIVSLLILCTVALPLFEVLEQGSAGLLDRLDAVLAEVSAAPTAADAYAERTMAYLCEASAEAAEGEIAALLAEQFGLPAAHCRTEVTLSEGAEGIILAGVKVYLSGPAILADAAEIEAYLAALFGGQAIVIIE